MVLEADIRDIVKDIRQCLRYSLFMDIPKIEGTNSRDYNIVEAVFEEVFKKCRGMGFEDNFFGVPKKGTDEHKTRDIFDECRVTMKKICFTDCIESTYYLLRRIVGAENPWTSYAWAQYLDASEYLNPGKTSGLDYLLNNLSGDKKIKADGIKYTFPPSVVGDSGKSTQLTSKINTIKKKLEAVGLDKVIDLGNDDARVLRVPIDRIDVIHMLGLKGQEKDYNVNPLAAAISVHKDKCNYQIYDYFKNGFYKYINNNNFTACDRVFLLYELENLFSFDIADSLTRCISRTRDTLHSSFIADDIRDLSCVIGLTNYTTRGFLIKFFFKYLVDYNIDYSVNFFAHSHNYHTVVRYMDQSENIATGATKINDWKRLYIDTVKYMGTLLFPVIESMFLATLLETIDGNDNIPAAFEILGKYINSDQYDEKHSDLKRMLDTDETKHNLDYWRTYRDTIKSLHSVRGSLKGNTDAIQPYTPRLCTVKYLKTAVDMLDKKATNMLIESIISA